MARRLKERGLRHVWARPARKLVEAARTGHPDRIAFFVAHIVADEAPDDLDTYLAENP